VVDGVNVVETYAVDTPRSSNLPSQAPNLTVGHEAKLIQFASAEALAAFCDAYDGTPADTALRSQQTPIAREAPRVDSLNIILYGPPGTGKTYRTAEMAVRICDSKAGGERAQLMRRYEELRREGRIRFVTFHQSYSYEDFVEGLRPELNNGQVTYRVRPGIFREACDAARRSRLVKPGLEGKPLSARTFYKMSLGTAGTTAGNKVFQECIEKGYIMLGWGEDIDFTECKSIEEIKRLVAEEKPDIEKPESQARFAWQFKNDLQKGDIVIVSHGNRAFRAIAEITGDYEFVESATFHQARRVRWLGVFEGSRPVDEIYDRDFMMSTLYRIQREGLKLNAIEALIRSGAEAVNQPFVLIVDEINRANISKVIGELITLMEADKREGAPNALTVKLPYSGDDFSVPDNLFILGTMNTADRSIALLDTALRRRFDFTELRPEPETLGTVDGVDLGAMLSALNRRIEYLYDRDHVIGHAYFMGVDGLDELDNVMRRRVIPLLQEYFYEDWSKVRMVLNDHAGLFIESIQATLDTKIAADDLEPKMRYQLRADIFPAQAYLNIYE
jgi:5-methylcytosine-specific restriction protein B